MQRTDSGTLPVIAWMQHSRMPLVMIDLGIHILKRLRIHRSAFFPT
ncbi:hypothetical protein [Xylella taiwanensis]|nr:hypothetical protein [Xylella taiwanensis]UFN03844.1 hypothetical protein LPH41_08120 [Xylella taiwanensis]UFN22353.1 hypothetical protein LPH48_10040 [Xylella taiwanensis]